MRVCLGFCATLAMLGCAASLPPPPPQAPTAASYPFSYAFMAFPSPPVSPGPDQDIEVLSVGGYAQSWHAHQLVLTGIRDEDAAALYAKHGAHELKNQDGYRYVWVPTPVDMDLTDLPRLASAAGRSGLYSFRSRSGAALLLQYLRLQADLPPLAHLYLDQLGGPLLRPGLYGTGATCLATLAGYPTMKVHGISAYQRDGQDVLLTMTAEGATGNQQGKPDLYACTAVVGDRLEVTLFHVGDLPASIVTCPDELPVRFLGVSPGLHPVYDAGSGRLITTVDCGEVAHPVSAPPTELCQI